MGNKIVTLITTFVVLMAFILLVAFISTSEQLDRSDQLIQEFTETVRYKGYITHDQYISLVNSIPFTDFKVQITHFLENEDLVLSPGVSNMRFTRQILGNGNSDKGYPIRGENGTTFYSGTLLYTQTSPDVDKGIYKMQVGDRIQVDLILMEGTFFDSIVWAITGSGVNELKKVSSASGIILNEKY